MSCAATSGPNARSKSNCSLRVGEKIISLPTRVVRNDRALSLAFHDLSEAQQSLVRGYVGRHAERQLERISSDEPTPVEPV